MANNPNKQDHGVYGWWARRTLRRADIYLANAKALADSFEAFYPFATGRVRLLHNPTNFSQIDLRAAEPTDLDLTRRPTIVSVGRLHPQKRFDVLLEAFARVRRSLDVELIILGDGDLRDALEKQAVSLGVQDAVRFPGFLTNPYAVMARANLFVLSSDFEGLPNALIEAQGLGIPAVATDCPTGPADIVVPGQTGQLVPMQDPQAMADAMHALLAAPAQLNAMGTCSRRLTREKFDAPRIIEQLSDMFANPLDMRRSA